MINLSDKARKNNRLIVMKKSKRKKTRKLREKKPRRNQFKRKSPLQKKLSEHFVNC